MCVHLVHFLPGRIVKWCEMKWKLLSCVRLFATPMDYIPPESSVHGILQARILEWVAVPFSRGSSPSQPGGWTRGSCIAGRLLTVWAPREGWVEGHHVLGAAGNQAGRRVQGCNRRHLALGETAQLIFLFSLSPKMLDLTSLMTAFSSYKLMKYKFISVCTVFWIYLGTDRFILLFRSQ